MNLIKMTAMYLRGGLTAMVLLGICFWREVPEAAVGPDRRAGKRGVDPDGEEFGMEQVIKCFEKNASKLTAATIPIAVRTSSVVDPICGKSVTLCNMRSSLGTSGSSM